MYDRSGLGPSHLPEIGLNPRFEPCAMFVPTYSEEPTLRSLDDTTASQKSLSGGRTEQPADHHPNTPRTQSPKTKSNP